ncbi:PCNA-associated factor [Trinorchestia longiramus]|nr:PCNA-associated factor [Trinorchestia longiramus]
MVRTKADVCSTRVSAAKAPRKSEASSPANKGGSKVRSSGGNPYNPQPTPSWQMGISGFLKPAAPSHRGDSGSSDSSAGPPASSSSE